MPYVHVVFTLPHGLLPLAYRNSTRLYTWSFHASAATLREVAPDSHHLGAEIGVLGILHTWGQTLVRHPHVHYLGRYTHRVAISNHRLLAFDGKHVTFSYKDYARGNQCRTMTLTAMEFLRRFVQHILPRGFVRIRQSGFLANTCRGARVALARTVLATQV